jgi:hypothetical protein
MDFSVPKDAERHKETTHRPDGEDPKPHVCECGKRFGRKDNLLRHQKTCPHQRTEEQASGQGPAETSVAGDETEEQASGQGPAEPAVAEDETAASNDMMSN